MVRLSEIYMSDQTLQTNASSGRRCALFRSDFFGLLVENVKRWFAGPICDLFEIVMATGFHQHPHFGPHIAVDDWHEQVGDIVDAEISPHASIFQLHERSD